MPEKASVRMRGVHNSRVRQSLPRSLLHDAGFAAARVCLLMKRQLQPLHLQVR